MTNDKTLSYQIDKNKFLIDNNYKKNKNIIRRFNITSPSYTGVVANLVTGKEGDLIKLILTDILENHLIDIRTNCFTVRTSKISKKFNKPQSRVSIAISEILKSDLIRLKEKDSWDYTFMFNPMLIQSCNVDTQELKIIYDSLPIMNKLSGKNKE